MSTLKQILTNEIKDLIGHEPNAEEFRSACDYVFDCVEKKHGLADIGVLLNDWRHDCMWQCQQCGDYFLNLKEYEVPFYPCVVELCSEKCRDEYITWNRPEEPEISQYI